MDFRDIAHNFYHFILAIGNLVLQLLWYFLQNIVSAYYFISYRVFKQYKSIPIAKLQYLAIVIESEDAHQTSKVVQLLQWLDSLGIKNVCLYDMNGVLKKSKEAIFHKMKNAKSIEEVNEAVTDHVPYHMTLEFVSYVDGKEAVAKAANLIFVENLKRHNLGGELDYQALLEPHLNQALQIVGCKGPEPDLLLVYGPVRSHLGFPAWRIQYTEIVHMGSLNFMRHGSLIKAIYNFTKVHQNYGKFSRYMYIGKEINHKYIDCASKKHRREE
ncbi:undecaprenyl pyrophosphate synthetase family protein, putative [Medicago truncatula]|uniref:ditrans,polycis-polyprenyl diphosphate synthase [(2E,6E)-farnesyldiphosphate specific] n=1 Tax=Medicago truncatula TaxID=3880 RepID=G7K553_MEDTR|nr:undecaprenyl pyrophosphate synthetase family protein, putative [Medicago truncatula]